MSGMHSTFSSSITSDKLHSYAVLSALQTGNATAGSQAQSSSPQYQHKDTNTASVSSFGSSASLLNGKQNHSGNSFSSGKSSSLVARQRTAQDANIRVLSSQKPQYWSSSIRNDL